MAKTIKTNFKYEILMEGNEFRHCIAVFQSSEVLEKFPGVFEVHVLSAISNEGILN